MPGPVFGLYLVLCLWPTGLHAVTITELDEKSDTCTPQAALQPVHSYYNYRALSSNFMVHMTDHLDLYVLALSTVLNISLPYTATSETFSTWQNSQGKIVNPIPIIQSRNFKPIILSAKPSVTEILSACFQKSGWLLKATTVHDMVDIKRLLTRLNLDSTFVNQYINTTCITELSDLNHVVMTFDDASTWSSYANKVALISKNNEYLVPVDANTYSFVCLTPTSSFGLKLNNNIKILYKNMQKLLHFLEALKSQTDDTNGMTGSTTVPSFHPRLPKIRNFIFKLQEAGLDAADRWSEASPSFASQISHLSSLSSTIVSLHTFKNGLFKIPSYLDFFKNTNMHDLNMLDKVYFSFIDNRGTAVLNLPSVTPTTVYRIIPFMHYGNIFKYTYVHIGPERFVTNSTYLPTQACILTPNCKLNKDWACVDSLFTESPDLQCLRPFHDPWKAKIISCSHDKQMLLINSKMFRSVPSKSTY